MTASLVAVLAPLVGVPVSAMTFHLRSLGEAQREKLQEVVRRMEALERQTRRLAQMLEEIARGYTTKEEWLRELMPARQQLQRLGETVARIQAGRRRRQATTAGRRRRSGRRCRPAPGSM